MLDGVPANGELVISYVGYKTASVKPDFNNEIKVVLERTVVEIKDGVVVIGYGNQKPSPSGARSDTANRWDQRLSAVYPRWKRDNQSRNG
jgi:hypothetical protein